MNFKRTENRLIVEQRYDLQNSNLNSNLNLKNSKI